MTHQTISHSLIFAAQLDELKLLELDILERLHRHTYFLGPPSTHLLGIDDDPLMWDSMITWFGDPHFTVPELDWAAQ